jgi:hypothetical protein
MLHWLIRYTDEKPQEAKQDASKVTKTCVERRFVGSSENLVQMYYLTFVKLEFLKKGVRFFYFLKDNCTPKNEQPAFRLKVAFNNYVDHLNFIQF